MNIAITSALISYSISQAFFTLSLSIAAFLGYYLKNINYIDTIIIIFAFIVQAILIQIPFMFRRLKNGIPFLKRRESGGIGIVIAGIIIALKALIASSANMDDRNFIVFILGTALCLFGTLYWWIYGIKKVYYERMRIRDMEESNKLLSEKDGKIEELIKINDELSKIVHRDNKLIPALYSAVQDFLLSASTEDSTALINKGEAINGQLNAIIQERNNSISDMRRENKKLPQTGILMIDATIELMQSKAKENFIDFDFLISGNVKNMTQSVIDESSLQTLIADHVENAIIAVKHNDNSYRKVVLNIGISGDSYEMSVSDSGIPFEINTLINLGLMRHTTHADSGGSGIGLMTSFEISKRSEASIIITENAPAPLTFTKTLSIRFDKKSEYKIISYRADEIKSLSERSNLMLIGN